MNFAPNRIVAFLTAMMLIAACCPRRAYAQIYTSSTVEEKQPEIQMDISEIGKKTDSFRIGQSHTWIIRGEVPDDIGTAGQYTVTQTLDHSLSYENGSLKVSLYTKEGNELAMEMESHYTLTVGTIVEGEQKERFSVALTPDGMAYAGANLGSGSAEAELRISFCAVINVEASMGTQIVGSAQLSYTSPDGTWYTVISDKPAIYTGGLHIMLTDPANNPLSGGIFMIARPASEEELAAPTIAKELLDTGGETIAVIYESFYSAEDLHGEKTAWVMTGKDGCAVIYGLAYGTYYLVQTETAGKGDIPMLPMKVNVNEVSHLTKADGWRDGSGRVEDNTVRIINDGASIPSTGGQGTAGLRVSGAAVLISACLLLLFNRRKEYK